MKYSVTVFTPAYNRAHMLGDLYKSLKEQTFLDFEWLIIDDGSVDETKKVVESFIAEKVLNIRYFYKENEGKHIAINMAAQKANGSLLFIVDSDDFLTNTALESIVSCERTIVNKCQYAGIAGLKGDFSGRAIKSPTERYSEEELINLTGKYIDATSLEYRYKLKIAGDRAEVVYTDVLKRYPFPKIGQEKFMEESYLWNSLSKDGLKFRWFNEVVYLCEYLEDGLTHNMQSIVKKNWESHCFCANYNLQIREIPIKERFRYCVRYYRYGKYGKKKLKELWKECNDKIISVPAIIIAYIKKVK